MNRKRRHLFCCFKCALNQPTLQIQAVAESKANNHYQFESAFPFFIHSNSTPKLLLWSCHTVLCCTLVVWQWTTDTCLHWYSFINKIKVWQCHKTSGSFLNSIIYVSCFNLFLQTVVLVCRSVSFCAAEEGPESAEEARGGRMQHRGEDGGGE